MSHEILPSVEEIKTGRESSGRFIEPERGIWRRGIN